MTQVEYVEKAKYIWNTFVPKSGQAATEQGELLRAIEKLRDEAQRNANANFNEECHGTLVKFLRTKLTDRNVFEEHEILQINSDLDRLGKKDEPNLDDDIFDRIAYRVVDWCTIYKEPIQHPKNPKLQC